MIQILTILSLFVYFADFLLYYCSSSDISMLVQVFCRRIYLTFSKGGNCYFLTSYSFLDVSGICWVTQVWLSGSSVEENVINWIFYVWYSWSNVVSGGAVVRIQVRWPGEATCPLSPVSLRSQFTDLHYPSPGDLIRFREARTKWIQ